MNVQILGPTKRNARVIKFFEQRGDVVSAREDLPTKVDVCHTFRRDTIFGKN